MQGRTKVSIFLSLLLLPVSGIWWLVLRLRHFLFDHAVLKSERGALPTVVLGNLAVGGTGKTPHSIAMLKLLKEESPAFLSRGYGRNSKGYVRILPDSDAKTVGDEPLLVSRAAPWATAAVCENRLTGLQRLKMDDHRLGIAVLDDAFQHRRLKGDVNVVLTTFDEPYFKDCLLPAGTLRDIEFALHRADAVIISKCPFQLSEADRARFHAAIHVRPLFFTSLNYGAPRSLHANENPLNESARVIAVVGIARPKSFLSYVEQHYTVVQKHIFRDHQAFSESDLKLWKSEMDTFAPTPTAILTTEKDAMRLLELPTAVELPIFYIPVEVKWEEGDEERMRSWVLNRLKGNEKL